MKIDKNCRQKLLDDDFVDHANSSNAELNQNLKKLSWTENSSSSSTENADNDEFVVISEPL